MGMLTIKTGPLAGRKFDNLLDYIETQEKFRKRCRHVPKAECGISGLRKRRKVWVRVRCRVCGAVLHNGTSLPYPHRKNNVHVETR